MVDKMQLVMMIAQVILYIMMLWCVLKKWEIEDLEELEE